MDAQIEKSLTKLPSNLQGNVFRMLGNLYKQEEETMISFIEEARRSLRLTKEESKTEPEGSSALHQKSNDERVDSAKSEKQRLGAISARHRQKSANQSSAPTHNNIENARTPLEQEVVRILSARSARSGKTRSGNDLNHSENDPNRRVPTPSHLFDFVTPEAAVNRSSRAPLCDDDFEEERDEIMERMSSEQNKLESVKERQSAMLKQKMDDMTNKQHESEVKATEVMMEAKRIEELQHSDKLRQEQKMRERLEEKKKNPADDGAAPVFIDVQPK